MKKVKLLGIRPVHPGRGEPSYIEANVILSYLKGEPVASAVISWNDAVYLIEQLAIAIRVTRP